MKLTLILSVITNFAFIYWFLWTINKKFDEFFIKNTENNDYTRDQLYCHDERFREHFDHFTERLNDKAYNKKFVDEYNEKSKKRKGDGEI